MTLQRHTKGRALLAQGKISPAVDACQAAARAAPEDVGAWQALGDAYQARGSYVAAINAYGKVIELDGSAIAGRYQLAMVQGVLGNVNDAIELFESVVQLQPKYLPAHVGVANVWIGTAATSVGPLCLFFAACVGSRSESVECARGLSDSCTLGFLGDDARATPLAMMQSRLHSRSDYAVALPARSTLHPPRSTPKATFG